MALAISATLVGSEVPKAVQVAVTGATIGDAYTVKGAAAGDVWTVRGGDSLVPLGTTFIVVDVSSPINVPVTYTVTHDADAASVAATPITVTYAGTYVITTLDGTQSTGFIWMNNADPLTTPMRNALYYVPGRAAPVARWDTPGADMGTLQVLTEGAQTDALKLILADAGGLIMVRTNGSLMDFPAVQILAVTQNERVMPGINAERIWTLGYSTASDPEPDTIVAAVTWADFDAAWATDTWTSFNASWATGTWDQFDQFDWTTL